MNIIRWIFTPKTNNQNVIGNSYDFYVKVPHDNTKFKQNPQNTINLAEYNKMMNYQLKLQQDIEKKRLEYQKKEELLKQKNEEEIYMLNMKNKNMDIDLFGNFDDWGVNN